MPSAQKGPAKAKYRHQLFIDHVTKNRWAVKWFDMWSGNHHRKRPGSVKSKRFATRKLRAAFVASGFGETESVDPRAEFLQAWTAVIMKNMGFNCKGDA